MKVYAMDAICSTLEEKRNAYEIVARKPEGKKPFRIHRCEDDNIKNLKEMVCGGGDRAHLGLDRNQRMTRRLAQDLS
jgi:hypothetical protein